MAQSSDVLKLRQIEVEKIKAERWDGALPVFGSTPNAFMNIDPAQYIKATHPDAKK